MSVLPIVTYPDPRLKRPSHPVVGDPKAWERLVRDMWDTMYQAPGVGLAAPQVGHNIRLFVVDVSSHQEGTEPLVFFNPELLAGDGELLWEEGCLSVPDLVVEMPRMERVRMAGLDLSGRRFEVDAQGLLAVALQHELDHLEGRLIIDRLSSLKRELYRKRRLREAAGATA
ncbi:MAG: peptide deformylase [Thermodesulfobacteriota bacterium]